LAYLLYPVVLYWLLKLGHRYLTGLDMDRLGFSRRGLLPGFVAGLALGAAAAVAVVRLTAVWQPAVSLAAVRSAGLPGAALIVLADAWETCFMEEFLFRGFCLPVLVRHRMGPQLAVFWSVLVFAVAHAWQQPLWWLLPIAATGLALSYLTYATASLWLPVGMHVGGNLAFGLMNRDILLQARGLEGNLGSLAVTECAVYLVLAACLLWWHPRQAGLGLTDFPVPRLLKQAGVAGEIKQ